MAENSLYTKQTNIGLLGAVFLFFLEKKYCYGENFSVSVKVPQN